MAKVNTVERAGAVETAVEKRDKSGDYSALQDWMCSIGEPMSSIVVSTGMSVVIIAVALLLKAIL